MRGIRELQQLISLLKGTFVARDEVQYFGLQVSRLRGFPFASVDATVLGSGITLANNETWQPFGAHNAFGGLILIQETASDGGAAIFLTGGGFTVEVADTSGIYSAVAGTANSINVYLSSLIVTIQNKRGGSRTLNVSAWRTREQN